MHYFVVASKVRGKPLDREGAKGVSVKYLVGNREGASKFFLREYHVAPGGNTSLDRHPYEHEVYILKGRANVKVGTTTRRVGVGNAVFVPSNKEHQFRNAGKRELVFLCVKGAEELYVHPRRT
ncbi:MAG: cupin domain-containing protein [Nitrososphaerales archaeon]|nr:cupin domain-containing protein [Nitrososphaerales archaeon]